MFEAQTSFQAEHASRYLQQLCKHLAHKVEARYDTRSGQVNFEAGQAELAAFPDRLELVARSADAEGLKQTKGILESHFIRFAFREEVSGLDWSN